MAAAGLAYTPVGALACQANCYLRQMATTVVRCEASTKHVGQHDVVLADSVLFPEGGGQPCDLGFVEGVRVTDVQRQGNRCVVTVPEPLEVGRGVDVRVDWARRIDHMQHHTAQHVLTAVVECLCRLPTESWALSHPTCYIQLPTAQLLAEDVARVEEQCNALIARNDPVQLDVYASREDIPPARSRGIPADVAGPIRIITVGDIDSCTCCGTHVASLGELQMLKLLHVEPKGTTCRLHFVAGNRVRAMFSDMYQRERALCKDLGVRASDVVEMVARRGEQSTALQRKIKKMLLEVSKMEAERLAAAAKESDLVMFYRDDADLKFLTAVRTAVGDANPNCLCVLACGVGEDGQILIAGPEGRVASESPKIIELLGAKGNLSKQGFRGKGNVGAWNKMQRQYGAT